jgi:hypothetical protein
MRLCKHASDLRYLDALQNWTKILNGFWTILLALKSAQYERKIILTIK